MIVRIVIAIPERPRVRGDRGIDRLVGHVLRERGVEDVELRVAMVAAEGESRITVEARMANDKLLIPIPAAVMPDAGVPVVAEEATVRDVGPTARADEVDPALEVRVGVVGETGVVVPETEGVATIGDQVRIQDG